MATSGRHSVCRGPSMNGNNNKHSNHDKLHSYSSHSVSSSSASHLLSASIGEERLASASAVGGRMNHSVCSQKSTATMTNSAPNSATASHSSNSSSNGNGNGNSCNKLKKMRTLKQFIAESIDEFVAQSGAIADENGATDSSLCVEMDTLVVNGQQMQAASAQFTADPLSTHKRELMRSASRDLLNSVGRFMAIANQIDTHRMLKLNDALHACLGAMSSCTHEQTLLAYLRNYVRDLDELVGLIGKRIQETENRVLRNELAAARSILAKQTPFLLSASKVLLAHPGHEAALEMHTQVYKDAFAALDVVHEIVSERFDAASDKLEHTSVFEPLVELERQIGEINPIRHNDSSLSRSYAEDKLSAALANIHTMVARSPIDGNARTLIATEMSHLGAALADLLKSLDDNRNNPESWKKIERLKIEYSKRSKLLKSQLRQIVAELFMPSSYDIEDTNGGHAQTSPTTAADVDDDDDSDSELIDRLMMNDVAEEEAATAAAEISSSSLLLFESRVSRLIESSVLACAMSSNRDGVHLAELASSRLRSLSSLCGHAASLVRSARSRSTHENACVLRQAWLAQVELVRLAVDDITSVNVLLAICERRLLDEINACIVALGEGVVGSESEQMSADKQQETAASSSHVATFRRHAKRVWSLVTRVCDAVTYELNNYETCAFVCKMHEVVQQLRTHLLGDKMQQAAAYACQMLEAACVELSPHDRSAVENEFIEAARLIYDAIRELRNSLLFIPQEDFDNVSEFLDSGGGVANSAAVVSAGSEGKGGFTGAATGGVGEEQPWTASTSSASSTMSRSSGGEAEAKKSDDNDDDENEQQQQQQHITQEQREQLNRQLSSFRAEKSNFDREVLKWDDKSNDIIVLSKEMCVIMMDMTNFTRGKGPFTSCADIIGAARKIADIGGRLERLTRDLADECPESQSKRELVNYLNHLPLFCNQLNIGIKVKENIIFPDSASSLIISSKNLMNAVISVVKYSYVASTKYISKTGSKKPIVQWKMRPPELKPLVNLNNRMPEASGLVRKAASSSEHKFAPVKTLSQFQL